MVLTHLDRAVPYSDLLRLLKIKPYGAPAGNIRQLTSLGLNVVYSKTDMTGLETFLRRQHPVIVFVRTGDLPYWDYNTDHALVAVGIDEQQVYLNDPNFAETSIAVSRGDFELAWLERDYAYALITL